MIIKSEMTLYDFCFWGGAVSHVSDMTHAQISAVEDELDSMYPDGMTEYDINDIFWFEPDFLAQCNGFDTWDEMMEFNNDEN
jgi:hypothetical protein